MPVGKMKQIPLTQDKYALVDDEDFEYLNQWKWFAHKDKNTWYAQRNQTIDINKRIVIHMHRVILQEEKIDHKDGNGLNNQRYNLRKASDLQNSRNKGIYKNNISGYKGVSFRKQSTKNPYQARIRVNKQEINLGSFSTAIEAALVYDQAAKQYFGEFARLNFSEE